MEDVLSSTLSIITPLVCTGLLLLLFHKNLILEIPKAPYPPVKSNDKISFLPDFPIVNTMGGGEGWSSSREGDIFGNNAFSEMSF